MINLAELIGVLSPAERIEAHFAGNSKDVFDPREEGSLDKPMHEFAISSMYSFYDDKGKDSYLCIGIYWTGEDKHDVKEN